MANADELFLIDGSGYIFRAYYAIRTLTARDGTPTNAVVGFARMLIKLLREKRPSHLAIAFDTGKKTFRHERYSDYKANREAAPDDLKSQIPLIHELVEALDIPCLTHLGYEADDVIATLAKKATESKLKVTVVSGDKDLMQLVDENVVMYDPMKDRVYDRAAVIDKWGVPPELVADVLALAGDSSDNIPGVPKVGPKSAAKLITEFGTVDDVLKGVKTLSKKKAYESSIVAHEAQAKLSKELALLAYDVPAELDLKALRYGVPKAAELEAFLRRIDAYNLMREFSFEGAAPSAADDSGSTQSIEPSNEHSPIDRSNYQTITAVDELDKLLKGARAAGVLSFDLETTSLDPNRADIVGVALATRDQPPAYIPVAHRYLGAPTQLALEVVLDALAPVLHDEAVRVVGQNLKYDMIVLDRAGYPGLPVAEDSMLAAYVLDPSRLSFSLDALAREVLQHETIKYSDLAGTGKKQKCFDEIDVPSAAEYAAEDAHVALELTTRLAAEIKANELDGLYRDIELALIPVLARMERTGILVNTQELAAISSEITRRLKDVEESAQALVDEPFNLASPKQLSTVLFDKLSLPVIKKTKTGYSTDQEVLETLAREHDLPRIVLEHRMLSKLKSTYVDALPRMVNPETGRVHTSFNQTGAATGRLSSSDPNLQNIPIRTAEGRRIRECFIAREGCSLLAADYSQIELRIMAHLSGDEDFIEAFRQGEDIHRRTATEILTGGSPPDDEARRRAKAINFGILYGLSEYGLSKQLSIPRKEAADYIGAYFARYPRIRQFLDRTIDAARERGYVSTLAGRRRFLPDLKSRNRNIRMGAERIAMNTPIQGSAADLIKIAMLRVSRALALEGLEAQMLLQVHDELVFEAPVGELEALEKLVVREMGSVMELSVPLVVDTGSGPNWSVAH